MRTLSIHRAVGLAGGIALVALGLTSTAVLAAPPGQPVVTGVRPNSGPTSGGTTVDIAGSNFKSVSAVMFGSVTGTLNSTAPNVIVATSPAESAGTVDVTVTTTHGGTSATSAADQFTYNSPPTTTVASVTPNSGATFGGTSVVLAGQNFNNTCTVTFGGVAAARTTFVSATEIDATTPGFFPPGPAPAAVTCGSSADSKVFTYFEAAGSTWSQLPGSAHDIASGAGQTFVVGTIPVNGGYGVFKWSNGGWMAFPGGLVDIAVGPDGTPWGVNSAHHLYHWSGGAWQQLPGSGYDIAVGAGGAVFVLGTNAVNGGWGIWQWVSGTWTPVFGGGTEIAVGAGDMPWIVNNQSQIWDLESGGWNQDPGSAVNIAADAFSVWVLGTNSVNGGHGLWYWNSGSWGAIDGGGVTIALGANTLPFVTNTSGLIWRRS